MLILLLRVELTLTHLKLRVLLVNHVQAAFTTYNLAVVITLFEGCSCFHVINAFLFVAVGYPAQGEVVDTHLNLHLVARKNLDVVHAHLARECGYEYMAVLQLDTELGIAKGLHNDSILLNYLLFRHM